MFARTGSPSPGTAAQAAHEKPTLCCWQHHSLADQPCLAWVRPPLLTVATLVTHSQPADSLSTAVHWKRTPSDSVCLQVVQHAGSSNYALNRVEIQVKTTVQHTTKAPTGNTRLRQHLNSAALAGSTTTALQVPTAGPVAGMPCQGAGRRQRSTLRHGLLANGMSKAKPLDQDLGSAAQQQPHNHVQLPVAHCMASAKTFRQTCHQH